MPSLWRPLGLTVPVLTPSCEQTKMILTDQSWHAVELRVIGALSLPRFHFARLQMEDFFLKWKNHMETAINSALFILSLWFPCVGKMRHKCAPSDSCGTFTAWRGMKYLNNERAFIQKNTCGESKEFHIHLCASLLRITMCCGLLLSA